MTKQLYIILSQEQRNQHGVERSLKDACQRLGVEYKELVIEDISLDDVQTMQFDSPALLYRLSTSRKATTLESLLVILHPGIFTTIYYPKTYQLKSRPFRELAEQLAAGLTIIPTSIVDDTWLKLNDSELEKKAQKLGNFPIVIKVLGLSHGQGVYKVDSMLEMKQLLAKLSVKEEGTVARKYLSNYRHFRIITVANEPVAAIEYHKPEDDFRTNAVEVPNVSAVGVDTLDPGVIDMAVAATKLRSSILSGVDVLVDQTDNTPYLAEVNVPCYYARAEAPTGIDISAKLITALLAKQQVEQQELERI